MYFDNLLEIAIWFFTAVSGISTGSGAYDLLKSGSSSLWKTLFLTILFTAGLQFTLLATVRSLKEERRWAFLIGKLLTYMFCAYFSVAFASSFWFKHTRAHDYAHEQFAGINHALNEDLNRLESRFGLFVESLEELAQYSRKTAEKERDQGHTCDDAGSGEGPRMDLRYADAELFNSWINPVRKRRKRLESQMESVRSASEKYAARNIDELAREVNDAVATTNALVDDPLIDSMRESLRERKAEGRTPFEGRGVTFKCFDPILERRIDTVLEVELTKVTPVEYFDPLNAKESLRLAFESLIGFTRDLFRGAWDIFPDNTETLYENRVRGLRDKRTAQVTSEDSVFTEDPLPLILGAMVDTLLFLAATLKKQTDGGQHLGSLGRVLSKRRSRNARRLLSAIGFSEMTDVYRTLRRYELDTKNTRFVAVPQPACITNDEQLELFAECLELAKLAALRGAWVTRRQLPDWWLNARPELAETTHFNVYEIRVGARRNLLLDLFAEFGTDSVHDGRGHRLEHAQTKGSESRTAEKVA